MPAAAEAAFRALIAKALLRGDTALAASYRAELDTLRNSAHRRGISPDEHLHEEAA